ncbi:MAG: protealysin inhibitor emfourin [Acidobacteriota bacterium]
MRLLLLRSGGVAGMSRKAVVDTEQGSPHDAEMRRLVAGADLARFSEATLRTGPDRLRYTLSVEDGHTSHSVTFDEERTPEQFRPLMEAILRHAPADDPDATKG